MISIEQLERLESRIFQALDLISDLRVENNQLEKEVKRTYTSNQKLMEINQEQDRKIQILDKDLKLATTEIRDLRQTEAALEHKVSTIISRLDDIESVEVHRSPSLLDTKVQEPLVSSSSLEDDANLQDDIDEISSKIEAPESILDNPDNLLQGDDVEGDIFSGEEDDLLSENISMDEQDIFISNEEVVAEDSSLESSVSLSTITESNVSIEETEEELDFSLNDDVEESTDNSEILMVPEPLENVDLFEEDHDFMLLEDDEDGKD